MRPAPLIDGIINSKRVFVVWRRGLAPRCSVLAAMDDAASILVILLQEEQRGAQRPTPRVLCVGCLLEDVLGCRVGRDPGRLGGQGYRLMSGAMGPHGGMGDEWVLCHR